MAAKQKMRYAHSEGHLDLCYDELGDHIITCGPDGDIRIYQGFDDDDPLSHRIGDVVYFVAFKNDKIYVASDDNTVRAFTFKDGLPDGIVTRFTAHVTHFCFNSSGNKLIAGASDFVVKIVDVETNNQKVFSGHEAPILSVSLNPDETFVASSSCDGTVKVWNVSDQTLVNTISGLSKCNDVSASKTLCRLDWDKKGRFLLIPMDKQINAYDVQKWSVNYKLTDSSVTELISIASVSPCGQYVAGATSNGHLLVWNLVTKKCISRQKHEKGLKITALAWHPQLGHIAYCDDHGYMGLLSDVLLPSASSVVAESADGNSLFDDNDDGLLMDAAMADDDDVDDNDASGAIPGIDTDVDDDIEDNPSPWLPAKQVSLDDNASVAESASVAEDAVVAKSITRSWEPVALQQPFQSSSSPAALSARFMVWNDVGVIIQYNTEEEQSINVEFHDTATHHAIHMNNTAAHTLADLSASAVVLAGQADETGPSQLVCMHFGSWDNCKEWSTVMPDGEDIQMLCLGDDWLAVATDRRIVRVFSICGTQKQIFSLSGPIVTMTAHGDMLLVAYHNGLGVPGDQCIAFQLLSVTNNKSTPHCIQSLPLSPKSTLVWLRFSKEGTPFSVDSAGIVRMFNRGFHANWIEMANLKQHCKGKSDNMWLVGIHESQQHMRAIMCKGSKYPPILPRPTVQLLPFQLPLCELSTDKSSLENALWQTTLLNQHYDAERFELEDRSKSQSLQESLMKLFALACKSSREVRATELCRMMPSSRTVQLAIKYASRLHLNQLADRLGEIARQKADEEESQLENIDNNFGAIEDSRYVQRSRNIPMVEVVQSEVQDADDDSCNEDEEESTNNTVTPRGSLLLRKKEVKEQNLKSLSDSQSEKRNPFKVGGMKPFVSKTPVQTKGTSVFDSMEKVKLGRMSASSGRFGIDSNESKVRNVKKSNSTSQRKLSDITAKQNMSKPEQKIVSDENFEISSFDTWFEANRVKLQTECGDECDESELTVKAMHKYRQMVKLSQSTSETDSADGDTCSRKRRRDAADDVGDSKLVECAPDSASSPPPVGGLKKPDRKLSSFMYSKNS